MNLLDLPEELILKILFHFPQYELERDIAPVCPTLNRICNDQQLWRKLEFEQDIPIEYVIDCIFKRAHCVREINLSNHPKVEDSHLDILTQCPQLEKVSLGGCSLVTDQGIDTVCNIKQLTHLDLRKRRSMTGKITDMSLIYISCCPNLEHLNLSGQKITHVGLEHLQHRNSLKRLYLNYTGIDDQCMAYIGKLSNLEVLVINFNRNITFTGLKQLRPRSKIKKLCLSWARNFNNDWLEYLSQFQDLEELQLCSNNVTNEGLKHLTNMSNLKKVVISGCQNIDEGGLLYLQRLEVIHSIYKF